VCHAAQTQVSNISYAPIEVLFFVQIHAFSFKTNSSSVLWLDSCSIGIEMEFRKGQTGSCNRSPVAQSYVTARIREIMKFSWFGCLAIVHRTSG